MKIMNRVPIKLFVPIITLIMALSFVSNPTVPSTAAQSYEMKVVIFDRPNFQGPSKPFGVGRHRLINEVEFNDLASSIKVSRGLGVIVYEHADEGGGYGEWVDFLEDQADLSRYRFDNKISYLEVFYLKRGNQVYERNKIENGRFVPGHWVPGIDDPDNPNPVVAPFKEGHLPEITSFEAEPNLVTEGGSTTLRWQTAKADRVVIGERYPKRVPDAESQTIHWQGAVELSGTSRKTPTRPTVYILKAEKGDQSTTKAVLVDMRSAPPTFCSVSGQLIGNRPSYRTKVELRRYDTDEVVKRDVVLGLQFRFENIPVGRYKVVPRGTFPPENGNYSNFGFLPKGDSITCRQNMPRSFSLSFRVHRYPD